MKTLVWISAAVCSLQIAQAADLITVYRQAQCSDPVFQQTLSQSLATKEGVPISAASLLPNINANMTPSITRSSFGGTNVRNIMGLGSLLPLNNTAKAYTLTLTATQTIFNFAQFSQVAKQVALSREADATVNTALQDLMMRTANAYFAVLRDEDNLRYSTATKRAFAEQLSQITQQYKVGLKTVTDYYTATASYDSAVANNIAAQTTLSNDKENLRAITGVFYPKLAALSEQFPLISPRPANINQWLTLAMTQNWSIRAQRYAVENARQNVHQQFAGHLPTVMLEGSMEKILQNNNNDYRNLQLFEGTATQTNRQIALDINVPLFSGGAVTAETNQAVYQYQNSQQRLEQIIRSTMTITRQSYLNLVAGISQIQADKEAIKSAMSSLKAIRSSYDVGTETLVDVVNQQQRVLQTETQYAADRYAFVMNILTLKQAAGTLSFSDLIGINCWLR